jgi:hypothetical protein
MIGCVNIPMLFRVDCDICHYHLFVYWIYAHIKKSSKKRGREPLLSGWL